VQQGCGVDEFHHRRHVEALLALVAKGAAAQQQQGRAQALAASGDDVVGHAANQGDARVQSTRDDLVDLAHVLFDDGKPGGGAGGCGLQGSGAVGFCRLYRKPGCVLAGQMGNLLQTHEGATIAGSAEIRP